MPVDSTSWAAVDLGSNSFHMIVVRVNDGGEITVIDRIREGVRLAEGLRANRPLKSSVSQRALDCLARFSERITDIPANHVRAVGTSTFRHLSADDPFIGHSEKILGHPIEVLSGREEARLLYMGVAHSRADYNERRLVIDIGGGSTELIVGQGFDALHFDSVDIGCVSLSQQFFADGVMTKARFAEALIHARLLLRQHEYVYQRIDVRHAVGSSGTIRALARVCQAMAWSEIGLNRNALQKLRKYLIKVGQADAIHLPEINQERKFVLAAGLVILEAVMEALNIDYLGVAEGALREGVIYTMVHGAQAQDVRRLTINAMRQKYQVDDQQVNRVKETALAAFDQVVAAWSFVDPIRDRQCLVDCIQLHEIGMAVSHDGFHRHGAYLVENSDMDGFSRREQRLMSAIILGQRKKLRADIFAKLGEAQTTAIRLCLLLRIAVLLHRGRRNRRDVNAIDFSAQADQLTIHIESGWLNKHPLTLADLKQEQKRITAVGVELYLEASTDD